MSGLVSWPIAAAAVRDRGRSPLVLALAGWVLCMSFGRAALEGASDGVGGLTWFWLHVFSFALAAGVIADEIESGHAQLMLLRPLTRAAWYGGRLLGAWVMLALVVILSGLAAVLGASLSRMGVQGASVTLLQLPFLLLDLGCWVALLAVVSVVARGWMNVAYVLFAILVWAALRVITQLGSARAPLADRLFTAISPYLHPHDSTAVAGALLSGNAPDLEPLLWNLLWLATAWAVGVLLMNRVELARRRT
jgi:hypothetical protein